jgi:hypothetical protein
MKINITYPEIQKYIVEHYAKQVCLTYIDNSTIRFSTKIQPFKVLQLLSPTINVDLKVENIRDTDIYLSYSGGLSIEIISPLLSFLKRLLPNKTNFIQEYGNHQLIVHIAEIEQAKEALEVINLESITFDKESINVNLFLK